MDPDPREPWQDEYEQWLDEQDDIQWWQQVGQQQQEQEPRGADRRYEQTRTSK